jgi:hypothetical protein
VTVTVTFALLAEVVESTCRSKFKQLFSIQEKNLQKHGPKTLEKARQSCRGPSRPAQVFSSLYSNLTKKRPSASGCCSQQLLRVCTATRFPNIGRVHTGRCSLGRQRARA